MMDMARLELLAELLREAHDDDEFRQRDNHTAGADIERALRWVQMEYDQRFTAALRVTDPKLPR